MRAFRAVVDSLEMKDGLLSMPDQCTDYRDTVDALLGYKFTPRGNDWTYGLAALFSPV